MNGIAIAPNNKSSVAAGWEICLVTDNVDAAYKTAIKTRCSPIVPTVSKPWGQIVSYVRDLNGCLVEIASHVGA